MGVIYCDRCTIGVHYTDVCPGGANGYPRKTKKQIRNEYLQMFGLVIAFMTFFLWVTGLIVGAPWS
jgi:hypothetical protein